MPRVAAERETAPPATALRYGADVLRRHGMRLLLEGWGCTVQTWRGMAEVEAAGPAMPSIVLVDYHLDNENGLDAIAALRRRYGGDLPAALVTADRSTELRVAASAADIAVINKPVKPAALRTVLARHYRMRVAAE